MYETYIDLEDLDRIKSLNLVWHLFQNGHSKYYYCQATKRLSGNKSKSIYLHRVILNIEDNKKYVDHINHNTLDNRKSNLRILENDENLKHRSGKNKNNTSGYRNVTWDKYYSKWKVQLYIDGKNIIFGYFDDILEAAQCAKEAREKHYREFAGVG